jgi:hypothetical protein
MVWMAINGLLFGLNYQKYNGPEWAYLRYIVHVRARM